MKTQTQFLKNVCLLLLLAGPFINACKCKKDEVSNPKYKISGRIYSSCNLPLANYPISLFRDGTPTLTGKTASHEETVITDEAGFFSVDFEDDGSGGSIEVRCDNKKILDGIPSGKEVGDVLAFKSTTACIQVKLNVINPHTNADTLKITDLANFSGLKIVGPLQSGVLYTAADFQVSNPNYSGTDTRITWYFNSYHGVYDKQDFRISKYCNDTIFVTATIN